MNKTLLTEYIKLIRPASWLKNAFVVFPLIFSLNLFDKDLVILSFLAFACFCLISSGIYVLNDIIDVDKDKLHPRKKNRPLASGKIGITSAIFVLGILISLSVLLLLAQNRQFAIYIGIYLVLNILYIFFLKNINLIESFVISSNFVIRVYAGCAAILVIPSGWIIIVTFFVSLFLTFIKRKSELKILSNNAVDHRKVLKNYTIGLLDKYIYISATITVFAYLLYSLDEDVIRIFKTENLLFTAVFVILGIFRFIQLSEKNTYNDEGDPTTLIFKDLFLQITIAGWLACIIIVIYAQ